MGMGAARAKTGLVRTTAMQEQGMTAHQVLHADKLAVRQRRVARASAAGGGSASPVMAAPGVHVCLRFMYGAQPFSVAAGFEHVDFSHADVMQGAKFKRKRSSMATSSEVQRQCTGRPSSPQSSWVFWSESAK